MSDGFQGSIAFSFIMGVFSQGVFSRGVRFGGEGQVSWRRLGGRLRVLLHGVNGLVSMIPFS